jgi:hypothetical protein
MRRGRQVVLIGDGLARGFGETVLPGWDWGAARRLAATYNANESIRHNWTFFET